MRDGGCILTFFNKTWSPEEMEPATFGDAHTRPELRRSVGRNMIA